MGEAISGNAAWDTLRINSLSGDGTTLAVGAPGEWGNNDRPGYVNVYKVHSGLTSTQVGADMAGLFGSSMSLSYDGRTIAIGAPGDWEINATSPGFVRIYRMNNDVFNPKWIQVGQDMYGETGDYQGVSVSLSADGNTLAVGAFGYDQKSGRVRIYRNDDHGLGNWTLYGNEIHGEEKADESGWSVSLSADGNTVAIGANRNDGNGNGYVAGHVRVFRIDDNESWDQIGQDIDGEAGDRCGESVSISADGNTIAVGCPGNLWEADRTGFVRIYRHDNFSSRWKQIGQDIVGDGYGDVFGVVVSLSADGATVAVSALAHDDEDIGVDAGQVKVFHYESTNSTWAQRGQSIVGEREYDYSGSSISLSADGKILAIASQWNDDNGENSGHVRIFSISQ